MAAKAPLWDRSDTLYLGHLPMVFCARDGGIDAKLINAVTDQVIKQLCALRGLRPHRQLVAIRISD